MCHGKRKEVGCNFKKGNALHYVRLYIKRH